MSRWGTLTIGLLLGVPGTIIVWRLHGQINELEPRAQKYDQICNEVQAALESDARVVGAPGGDALLTRVGGDRGDDSFLMLGRCLPAPFLMDEWNGCLRAEDAACLRRILTDAAASIPR